MFKHERKSVIISCMFILEWRYHDLFQPVFLTVHSWHASKIVYIKQDYPILAPESKCKAIDVKKIIVRFCDL